MTALGRKSQRSPFFFFFFLLSFHPGGEAPERTGTPHCEWLPALKRIIRCECDWAGAEPWKPTPRSNVSGRVGVPPSASTASTSPSVGPCGERGFACVHVKRTGAGCTRARGRAGLSGEAFNDHGDVLEHIGASSSAGADARLCNATMETPGLQSEAA